MSLGISSSVYPTAKRAAIFAIGKPVALEASAEDRETPGRSVQSDQQLVALVDEANRAGFTLRVALISSSYDLGSITSLWQKPQTYARFLGAELKYVYKNRLLVVMPNGFGFNRPGRSAAPEYAVLAKIPVKPGPTGLVDSSLAAVQALAKASGVTLSGTTSARPSSRNHDRLIIVIAALAALAVAVVLRLVLRR